MNTEGQSVVYVARDRHGEPLYVGCTNNLAGRIASHISNRAGWVAEFAEIKAEGPMSRTEALAREAHLIATLSPRHNRNRGVRIPPAREPAVSPEDQRIGSTIRELRTLGGMTQDELAKASRISRSFLANVELGRKRASGVTLSRVAKELGVPRDRLFDAA